jgi:DNA-directed RNA polymerase specialized sigma24 family protein
MKGLDFSEKELQEVLVGCIFGKESSWKQFIFRYNPLITGTSYRYGKGLVEADEVSQLVFETLLKNQCEKLRAFKGRTDAEFTSYLFRITRNITWNLLKYENFRESKKDTHIDWEDIP